MVNSAMKCPRLSTNTDGFDANWLSKEAFRRAFGIRGEEKRPKAPTPLLALAYALRLMDRQVLDYRNPLIGDVLRFT
jgi:hypothetical protein